MTRDISLVLCATITLVACADIGEGQPEPRVCRIEPVALTVAPQATVTFTVDCAGRFEFGSETAPRSWSPDGNLHEFEYSAPELPGVYDVTVVSAFDNQVRATAAVTVEAREYDVSSDLVWSNDLANRRAWWGPNGTVVVQSDVGKLTFMDASLNTIASYDGWNGHTWGALAFSSNPDVLYLLGAFHGFRSNTDHLVRFDRSSRTIERFYVTGSRALRGDWGLQVSPDETLAAWWLPDEAVVRELNGDQTVFRIYELSPGRWAVEGIGYDPIAESDEVLVLEGFTGPLWVEFSPSGRLAAVGARHQLDLRTGVLLDAVLDMSPICRAYNISDRDCPDRTPIPIDEDRVLTFGWPAGRPTIVNRRERTIEVSPPETGPFASSEPAITGWEFNADRTRVWVTGSDFPPVMLDLTTQPVSALWSHPSGSVSGTFGPDGERLLVLHYAEPGNIGPPAQNVAILDVETGTPLQVRAFGARGNSSFPYFLRWSPDGDHLLANLGGTSTMYRFDGTPIWETDAQTASHGWVGDRMGRIRRDSATDDIQAIEFLHLETLEPTGEELVLDFGMRQSSSFDGTFYSNRDGSLVWLSSDAMAEGGMAFDAATGAWREDILSTPAWAEFQLAVEQPRGPEPRDACPDPGNCSLQFECGAWDPTGRFMAEAWSAGNGIAQGSVGSFRLVDDAGTTLRELRSWTFGSCQAAAWHPTEDLVAIIDGSEVAVLDTSDPMGRRTVDTNARRLDARSGAAAGSP